MILPVMLDDILVPGMPKTTTHVDGRTKSPEEVADLTMDHLREYDRDAPRPSFSGIRRRV